MHSKGLGLECKWIWINNIFNSFFVPNAFLHTKDLSAASGKLLILGGPAGRYNLQFIFELFAITTYYINIPQICWIFRFTWRLYIYIYI